MSFKNHKRTKSNTKPQIVRSRKSGDPPIYFIIDLIPGNEEKSITTAEGRQQRGAHDGEMTVGVHGLAWNEI